MRFIYKFDRYEEYDDIAPCKYCGSRPYRSVAGIECRKCGYAVSWHGQTIAEGIAEWNADPEEGIERAEEDCDVAIEA